MQQRAAPAFSLWTKVALAFVGVPLFVVGVIGMALSLYFLWVLLTSL